MSGISFTIDGTDGAGKRTQSVLLMEHLQQEGNECTVISFPQHGETSSNLVDEFLYKDLEFTGDTFTKAVQEGAIYAIDRSVTLYKKREDGKSIMDKYNEGKILIFDRYLSSNFIHRSKYLDKSSLVDYIWHMEKMEFELLNIPKPDITFVLITQPEIAYENILKRGREMDKEETLENQKLAFAGIRSLCTMKQYIPIECCKKVNGKWVMRCSRDIHEDIWKHVKKFV